MLTFLAFIKYFFDNLISNYQFVSMSYKWRRKNRHNKTFASNYFPIEIVSVGNHTYGTLKVKSYCLEAGEKLEIGNYVSIADDVVFILGGNHQINTFTTFPLKAYFSRIDNPLDSASKGPIIIEDEVWIGTSVIILSGVTIGRGAIIGAGSVVTKDVPPFAIVVGNPSKIIKYRFSDEILIKLNEVQLSKITRDKINKNMELFYQPLNNNSILESIKNIK